MNSPSLASIKNCTGCLACVDSCFRGALSKIIANDGHIYVACDSKKCVLCHKCESICPVSSKLEYSSNKLLGTIPYSSFTIDNAIYSRSTSGGLFAALAYKFIDDGGYVCGAILHKNSVLHILSNKKEDIRRMQGAKYMQSHMDGIYKDIANVLKNGNKVLFCGMGCQSAGIYSYFKNSKFKENLYVLDMICGGVPSSLLVSTFLNNEKDYSEILSFRKKQKYVLTCRRSADGSEITLENKRLLPLYGFYGDLTKRYSCGDCKFCGVERLSDITIGDYWGNNSPIHKSVALVHSEKGNMLLKNNLILHTEKINWDFLQYNFRCVVGYSGCNDRTQRKLLSWNFKYLPYSILCGIYGCRPKSLLWLPLSIYNVLYGKLLAKKKKHLLSNILKDIKKRQ